MKKGTLITVAFLVALTAVSIDLLWMGNKYECDICIEYKNLEVCQKVKGIDLEETKMGGVSTACGGAANGMTENIECQAIPPTKMDCQRI